MYREAIGCGVACFAFLVVGGQVTAERVPEWVWQLAWLVLVGSSSAWCAYREPRTGWRAGAALMGVHLPCFLILMAVTGELARPTSSTGGMVALFIGSVFITLMSPLPMLTAGLAARARRRHDRSGLSS